MDENGKIWGQVAIGKILFQCPGKDERKDESLARMVRKVVAKYRYSSEPLPIYSQVVGRGKNRKRMCWSKEEWLYAWMARKDREKTRV